MKRPICCSNNYHRPAKSCQYNSAFDPFLKKTRKLVRLLGNVHNNGLGSCLVDWICRAVEIGFLNSAELERVDAECAKFKLSCKQQTRTRKILTWEWKFVSWVIALTDNMILSSWCPSGRHSECHNLHGSGCSKTPQALPCACSLWLAQLASYVLTAHNIWTSSCPPCSSCRNGGHRGERKQIEPFHFSKTFKPRHSANSLQSLQVYKRFPQCRFWFLQFFFCLWLHVLRCRS